LQGEETLKIANKKHDVVALRIHDIRESELPSVGLAKLKDAESGAFRWVDTSDKRVRDSYKAWGLEKTAVLNKIFTKCGVDHAAIRTDESYVRPLMNLFKMRGGR